MQTSDPHLPSAGGAREGNSSDQCSNRRSVRIRWGWLSGLALVVAGIGLLLTAVSAVGIPFGLRLEFEGAELPSDWEDVLVFSIGFAGLGLLAVHGAFFRTQFQAAKGRPRHRLALAVLGFGIPVMVWWILRSWTWLMMP